jgi:hypothetical protein
MFIAFLVLVVVLIINFFRLIWLLAKTFLSIILLVIFSPLQLTVGVVVPGMGFGSWVRSLVSKLAVFPMVGALFILSLFFLQTAQEIVGLNSITGTLSAGPNQCVAGSYPAGWPPLIGGSPQMIALLFVLVSLALFVMIPSAGGMVESFMSGKQFGYGSAIGEAVSPITGTLSGYAEGQSKRASNAVAALPYDVMRSILSRLK